MKINHIGFAVTEVPATVELLETYFGMERAPQTPVSSKMAFLLDKNGSLITFFKADDAFYPQIFHIGFMQETVEQVKELHEKITAGGYNPEEIREEHGRLTFYFMAPGGFMIEVNSLIEAKRPELKDKVNSN
ncbi:VOC family protein [Pedobacter cryoconitis]|uniref:VOC family protein n=1 Tax=Pedobacter cryoconitis TaxID=188932 RepID=UPI001619FF60|nr:VOC family protein [Pedobacter cryoconitis]MBB5647017.1 catechol 2,3-dioxygenase-like lactoylglutathione lyase family enzyme [Pedobacter cryoconitis]